MAFFVCLHVCLCPNFPLLIRKLVIFDLGSTQIQHDPISAWLHYKDPSSNYGHIPRVAWPADYVSSREGAVAWGESQKTAVRRGGGGGGGGRMLYFPLLPLSFVARGQPYLSHHHVRSKKPAWIAVIWVMPRQATLCWGEELKKQKQTHQNFLSTRSARPPPPHFRSLIYNYIQLTY